MSQTPAPEGPTPPASAPRTVCLNCAAPVTGNYCAACGQRRDLKPYSLGALLWELVSEIVDSDARIWRTLRSLVRRPGQLTLDWMRGRRAAFMPPFRLYLVLNLLAFVVLSLQADVSFDGPDAENLASAETRLVEQLEALRQSEQRPSTAAAPAGPEAAARAQTRARLERALTNVRIQQARLERDSGRSAPETDALADQPLNFGPAQGFNVQVVDDDMNIDLGGLQDWLIDLGYPTERIESAARTLAASPEVAIAALYARLPTVMILLLPLMATLMRLLYLFAARPWVVHLVALVHLHSFTFLLLLLIDGIIGFGLLLEALGAPISPAAFNGPISTLGSLGFVVYLVRWTQVIYGHGWLLASLVSGVLLMAHVIGAVLGIAGIALLALVMEVMFPG